MLLLEEEVARLPTLPEGTRAVLLEYKRNADAAQSNAAFRCVPQVRKQLQLVSDMIVAIVEQRVPQRGMRQRMSKQRRRRRLRQQQQAQSEAEATQSAVAGGAQADESDEESGIDEMSTAALLKQLRRLMK